MSDLNIEGHLRVSGSGACEDDRHSAKRVNDAFHVRRSLQVVQRTTSRSVEQLRSL